MFSITMNKEKSQIQNNNRGSEGCDMRKCTIRCLLCGIRSIQKRICETWTKEMKLDYDWIYSILYLFLSEEVLTFIYALTVHLKKWVYINWIVNCLLIFKKFFCWILKYSLLSIFSFAFSDSRCFLEINENSKW